MADQIELRNQILALCLDHIDNAPENAVTAYVACFGAAATCAAILAPNLREKLINGTEGTLLDLANKRAGEMRSGELDRELIGH